MDEIATKYLEVERDGIRRVVTEKAYHVIYQEKGFKVVRRDVAPPNEHDDEKGSPDDDAADPFDLEVARVSRGSIEAITAWIEMADDPEQRIKRGEAIFNRENLKAQPRTTLLDKVSDLVTAARGGETKAEE